MARIKYVNRISLIIITFILCNATLSTLSAQQMKKVAQTGFQFLKISPDARGAAMGGAFVAAANNSNALFWNPAGISRVEGVDVSINNVSWIADINQFAGAAAINFGRGSYVGLSLISANYGAIPRTIPSDNIQGFEEQGTFSPGAFAIGIGYARQFSELFTLGGQVRYAHESLGSSVVQRPSEDVAEVKNQVGGLAFDIGTLYYTGFKDLRISMAIRNFSRELHYEFEGFEMPLTFDLGMAMDLFSLTNLGPNHKLTLAADIIHPRDYTERAHIGAEYLFLQSVALRAGYKVNYDSESLTAGFGIQHEFGNINLRIDYAYNGMGTYLGSVHRFSIGASL